MKHKILIIDDDATICKLLSLALESKYDVLTATNAKDGLEQVKTQYGLEVVLLDLKLGVDDGLEVLQQIKEYDNSIIVIMMTAFGSIQTSVDAMKRGAFTYLTKPVDIDELNVYIEQALSFQKLGDEVEFLSKEIKGLKKYQEIVGKSFPMQRVYAMINRLKDVDTTVTILGESGTGKELVARALHNSGNRKSERFVVINCAAIPENLLEEELFGHKRGTFTGAVQDKRGKLEIANGGTIFLDEIGDMPLRLQSKLLRVIQQKEYTPLGGTESRHVDVRIIAATNQDLKGMVEKETFREDLFYRLNVVTIPIPPLRERKEDIPLLCNSFIEKFNNEQNKAVKGLSLEAQQMLEAYDYPGNIRQLENAIEYAMIFSDGDLLLPSMLPWEIQQYRRHTDVKDTKIMKEFLAGKTLKSIEKLAIVATLERNNGHRESSAQELGISLRTLQYKISEYNL